jgi:WD40 repeat protein
VKIWDLRVANPSAILLHGHPREVQGGAYSSDGTQLVTTDTQTVLLWDVRNLATPTKTVLQEPARPPVQLPVFAISVALSPDQSQLATSDNDGVRLWDMRNPVRPMNVLPGSQGSIRLAFSPDGTRLAVTGREGVRLWDLRNPESPLVLFQGTQIGMVAFSPDGARLAAGTGNVVRIWELRNPAAAPELLRGHPGVVMLVAFAPDGSRVVSGGNDGTVRIWELHRAGAPLLLPQDVQSRVPEGVLSSQPPQRVVFSHDSRYVYSGAANGSVRTWDLQSAGSAPLVPLRERMPAPMSGVRTRSGELMDLRLMDLSDDGTRLALAALNVNLWVWDHRRPTDPPIELPDQETLPIAARGAAPTIRALRLSPDGSLLAVHRTGSRIVWLWDLTRRSARALSFPGSAVTCLAFSPDGSRLAAGYGLDVSVWDLRKPETPPVVLPQPPQVRNISAMAFSRDNRYLAVGLEDVRVWDLHARQTPAVFLRGFPSMGFYALAFSPDGKRLAGGNMNGTTQLWDLGHPTTPVSLTAPGSVVSVAFAPNGHHLAVGARDGSVRVWSLGQAAADDLCTRVWRNLSMDEWRFHVGESLPYQRTCPGLPPGIKATIR